ncbi:extracellular solute-binding protein [Georgenia yuyongxinii]|uniref:Extracellular solute-binding protein n=1 Tax=Georgenia yuyongxinii TaxID=2589797 RepID=A0A552WTP9_9MICO|nr:extracellular solute-binding protein [Georgenia yuyongxinii]TRW46117.1 extracellular solute-binding protein [Georgenia yuyongxinii]
MSIRTTSRAAVVVLALAAAGTLAACGSDEPAAETTGDATTADAGPLTIYSGRNEELVGPILDQLEAAVGTDVEVRYAGSSELAAQLLEEGEGTDADLFFSQDAGALGALAKADRLATLPDEVLNLVDPKYRDDDGRWVATSARARVLAYDPAQAPEVEEFTGIDQILDAKYQGKIAYAPTNASFHAFVTALRMDRGEDGARQWLEDFAALEPQAYDNNNAVLDAVDSGQAAIGLINHYYWYEKVAEQGADAVAARIRFLDADDPGALINVAGVGVLAGSDAENAAFAAVEYLLSDEAQQYFADTTAEYPVVEGITTTEHDLTPLSELSGSTVDLNDLDSLDQTLALLDEVGLT